MTTTLFLEDGPRVIDLAGGGTVKHWRGWLSGSTASSLFEEFRDRAPWAQREIEMFGRKVKLPRLTCWFGDHGTTYGYSGIVEQPWPMTTTLDMLRWRLYREIGTRFNSCLANYYRDGNDYVSMHADDEPELGPQPTIASISLGASRRFVLAYPAERQRISMTLDNGDLLVMSGPMQRDWTHGVPKMDGAGPRINLTLRQVNRR